MEKLSTPRRLADYVHFHDPERKIRRVATPSHGGISVARDLKMPDHLAALGMAGATGCLWFEEDLAWSAVPAAFPQHFTPEMNEAAQQTLRHHFPEAYVAQFGGVLTASTSRELERREWESATANKFVVTTGFGDWAWNVPKGHVYACGWRRSDEATAGFLVPSSQYVNEGRLVLDGFPRREPARTLPYFKPKAAPALATAPALLCAALCLLANHAAIAALMAKHVTRPMRELLRDREHVESLLSLATNLAFVGSAIGVVFGFNESSREAFLVRANRVHKTIIEFAKSASFAGISDCAEFTNCAARTAAPGTFIHTCWM